MAIHRIRLWFRLWWGRNRIRLAGGCAIVILAVVFTVRSWEHEGGRGLGRGVQEDQDPVFRSLDPPLVGLILLRNAKAKNAFCLDGSPPGYHLLRGEGAGSDKWLLHLEGGGWCNDAESCASRGSTPLGSSMYMEAMHFVGILSPYPSQNPDVLGIVVDESDGHAFASESSSDSKSDGSLETMEATSDNDIQEIPLSGSEAAKKTQEVSVKTDLLNTPQKNGRKSRVAPPGLDEFKNKAFTVKESSISSQPNTIFHRVEPSGLEYNYASATKGAKVLAFNKEAKGASNILDKDKDKYLRNPCSAEEKYVVIELSEETLVDSLEIANFEHYSSNLKDFELFSSLVYPTDSWVKLGNFTAQNVKHAQRFVLPEPKWARYLKFNLLSHYGSEFYCTLSVVEVYGVDAVERMLEDLISVENKKLEPEEPNVEKISIQDSSDRDDMHNELLTEIDHESKNESPKTKPEASKNNAIDPVENRPSQVGRMPGDTVLKILMQKVQSFDVNFSILERYLEEINSRYGHIFKELDDDIATKDSLLEKTRLDIDHLQKNSNVFADQIGDLLSWKFAVSMQLEQLVKESAVLRSEIEISRNHQADVENRGAVVLLLSLVFGCVASSKLLINMLIFVCRMHDPDKFCRTSSAWFVLLFSSSIIMFILVA